MTNFRTTIDQKLAELTPKYTELLRKFVRIPSQLGQESKLQLEVRAEMEGLGLKPATVLCRPDLSAMNLAATLAGAGDGRSLILDADADITPVEGNWKHGPYDAVVEDGILHGRGSQDDKAGIAVILMATECLMSLGIKLKGDLVLQIVVEDETTGNGSKALVDAGFGADGVIICDGTWPERIIYAHLGQLWLDVAIAGQPVAACVESRGINPIYLGSEYISKLRAWADKMNQESEKFENIDKPFFVNAGSFHSGVWHGSVPASAKLEIQMGFGPGHQPDEILQTARQIAAAVSERIVVEKGLLSTPAWKVPRDNELIAKLKPIIEKNSGKEVRTQAVTGHCDMRHFPTQNICLYGPGAGWNPHGVDERYQLSDMPVVARNLIEFAVEWCGVQA